MKPLTPSIDFDPRVIADRAQAALDKRTKAASLKLGNSRRKRLAPRGLLFAIIRSSARA